MDLTTRQIVQTGEGAVQYKWSPNGDYFACAVNLSRVEIYDRNGQRVDTYSLKQGYISQLGWLDDRRIFMVPTWTTIMTLSEHALIVYDVKSKLSHKWLASSDKTKPRGPTLSEGTRVSVSPDRRLVAAIVTEWQQESQNDPSWQEIVLVRIGDETITKLQTTRTSSENIIISGWSPDSTKVLFTRGEEIWTVNRNDTGLQRLTKGYAPQWSPDGRHIAFLRSPKQGEYELWVMRVEPA